MKQTGKCPKCESSDVIQIPGQIGAYGSGNNVPLGLFKSPVKVTRFLCGKCGFSEEWVDSVEDIERLRKKYAPRGFEVIAKDATASGDDAG